MKLCGTATFRPSLFAGGSASGGTNGSQPRYMDGMDGWMDHPKRLGAGAFFPHLLSCVCLDRMWLQWVRTLLKIFFEVRKVRKIELESMLHLNGTKALDLVSIM